MASTKQTVTLRRKPDGRRYARLMWAVMAGSALVLVLQTLNYRGIVARVAEWQFGLLDRYYPLLTVIAFLALIGLPIVILRKTWRRRTATSRYDVATADGTSVASATRFTQLLLGSAVICFGGALVALVPLLTMPTESGPVRRVVVGDASAVAPAEGATALVGAVALDRIAVLDENLLVTKRTRRFAPVLIPGVPRSEVRYLVELGPDEDRSAQRTVAPRYGILRRDALPGQIVRLYRGAGSDIDSPHYVLFRSKGTMRWPYLVNAVEFGIAGLILLGAGLMQYRHRNRVRTRSVQASIG